MEPISLYMSTGEAVVLSEGGCQSTIDRGIENVDDDKLFNAAVNGVESLLLSLYNKGIITPENAATVAEATEGTVIAIAFNLGLNTDPNDLEGEVELVKCENCDGDGMVGVNTLCQTCDGIGAVAKK